MLFTIKKRIVFMGTPAFAVPALEAMLAQSWNIIAVYTQPDREAGRGQRLQASPVKQIALSHDIPVEQPERLKSEDTLKTFRRYEPDVIVVAAYGRLIPSELLHLPPYGCLNIHPSLLPRFRGSSPVAGAILNGDDTTGVSIMLLDEGMDTGPILTQTKVPVSLDDTAGSLTDILARKGAQLLVETLPQWLEGSSIHPQPQGYGLATYTKPLTREDGKLNWHLSAIDLWRQVRAYNPWPGSYTAWQGKRLKINEALPLDLMPDSEPGRVVALPENEKASTGVVTGNGILGIVNIQIEGKRVMSIDEFVQGYRTFIGSLLD